MVNLGIKGVIALLAVYCGGVWAITFEQALLLYNDKQYERAYQGFDELAKLGNGRAQYNLAVMYARGEFVERDFTRALAWSELAEQNGAKGVKTLQNALKKQFAADSSELKQQIAKLLPVYGAEAVKERTTLRFEGIQKNRTPARVEYVAQPSYPRAMARASKYGWVDVQFVVGEDGVPRYFSVLHSPHEDFSDASLEAIRRSRFKPREVNGQSKLSFGGKYRFVFQMEGTKVDAPVFEKYVAKQRSNAVDGSSNNKLVYARFLEGARSLVRGMEGGDAVEFENPVHWYQQAAIDGQPLAKYNLGMHALEGGWCELDNDKALFWLQSAADDKVLDAQFALGYEYYAGGRFRKDEKRGLEMIAGAAQEGLDHARVHYAWLLATQAKPDHARLRSAQALLDQIEESEYSDKRSYYEAKTAMYLKSKDWKKAKKYLKKLSRLNKRFKVSTKREAAMRAALTGKTQYIESV